jgi:SpoVK/Ycf46/Vps4 family AAA+-type ATPase
VDEKDSASEDVVQIARLALSGRPQDVRAFIARLSRRYAKRHPQAGARLQNLLIENPSVQSPIRGSTIAVVPVDADSRLKLLRHDSSPMPENEPVWMPQVAKGLASIVSEHNRSAELIRAGLAPTRTALFTGAPGLGKTLAAKWLAGTLGLPLMTLDLSAVISSYLGRTGSNVRYVLDYAKGVRCVLLLDEIDSIAKRRDDTDEIGELKRLVTVLLQEIDDWPVGSLLVAATNHPDLLDPAVWRRFEMHVNFPAPDAEATARVLKTLLRNETYDSGWDAALCRILTGFSFNNIEVAINVARKRSLLSGQPLDEAFVDLAKSEAGKLTKVMLKTLASDLTELGLTERRVREITGLSRDTIRKSKGV